MNNKKNILVIILIVFLFIITLIVLVSTRRQNKQEEIIDPNQTELELDKIIIEDTTLEIKENLDNINITDESDDDLKMIDEELKNL